ncbi:hypothetical protein [Candidatus Palauibacter sp.]|uniref:hypothetical protein n=1 Tax=Candidatus Palauibacter sp. TaxID=3101350 RepID=UPI003B59D783
MWRRQPWSSQGKVVFWAVVVVVCGCAGLVSPWLVPRIADYLGWHWFFVVWLLVGMPIGLALPGIFQLLQRRFPSLIEPNADN